MKNPIFYPRFQKILAYIYQYYNQSKDVKPLIMSMIAIKIETNYSHVTDILKEMQKKGWVFLEKEGRCMYITLTKKGKEHAISLERMMRN